MIKINKIAEVSPSEEDQMQVKVLKVGYLYSFISRGIVEFSVYEEDFNSIERSINRQYGSNGLILVEKLKKQLDL